MPTTPLPLSAAVLDVLALGHDMLTPIEAGRVIGRAHSTLSEACVSGDIEAHFTNSRGQKRKRRWCFSRAALLTYIWNNTTGDKALMRSALAQHAPDLLAHLEPHTSQTQPLPDNVIPISSGKRKRPAHDPLAGNIGDLFSHLNVG